MHILYTAIVELPSPHVTSVRSSFHFVYPPVDRLVASVAKINLLCCHFCSGVLMRNKNEHIEHVFFLFISDFFSSPARPKQGVSESMMEHSASRVKSFSLTN